MSSSDLVCEENVETFNAKEDPEEGDGSDDEDKLNGNEWQTDKELVEQVFLQ